MKIHQFYLKMEAGKIPAGTTIYKDTPDPRSRKRLLAYTLTNKISFYSDDNREVIQYSKKMLYLIDQKSNITFIAPDKYVSIGFDTIKELQDFILTI